MKRDNRWIGRVGKRQHEKAPALSNPGRGLMKEATIFAVGAAMGLASGAIGHIVQKGYEDRSSLWSKRIELVERTSSKLNSAFQQSMLTLDKMDELLNQLEDDYRKNREFRINYKEEMSKISAEQKTMARALDLQTTIVLMYAMFGKDEPDFTGELEDEEDIAEKQFESEMDAFQRRADSITSAEERRELAPDLLTIVRPYFNGQRARLIKLRKDLNKDLIFFVKQAGPK